MFVKSTEEVAAQVKTKFLNLQKQYDTLLQNEKDHIKTLKESLQSKDMTASERAKILNEDQVN